MERWLTEAGMLVALLVLIKWGKPLLGIARHVFSVSKSVHETDTALIAGYKAQLELERAEKESAVRIAARLKLKNVEQDEQLKLRDDVNERDRVARLIYLKHLRDYGANIGEIEREIRLEVERTFRDGFSHSQD